ncbi:hypothetical protein D3C81_1925630 [compost metagenome]
MLGRGGQRIPIKSDPLLYVDLVSAVNGATRVVRVFTEFLQVSVESFILLEKVIDLHGRVVDHDMKLFVRIAHVAGGFGKAG